jgi:hypothetical protein
MNSQCTPTNVIAATEYPVCSDKITSSFNTGILKLSFSEINSGATVTFSTVGETTGDTFLSYYDSVGNLLAFNDDESNCGGCKQSTVSYTNSSGGFLAGSYLIVSKPSCGSLDFDVKIKYNQRSAYDEAPVLIFPPPLTKSIDLCSSPIVTFMVSGTPPLSLTPWTSLDTSVATINSSTGEATFIKSGVAKIQVEKAGGACKAINNYIVNIMETSIITSN